MLDKVSKSGAKLELKCMHFLELLIDKFQRSGFNWVEHCLLLAVRSLLLKIAHDKGKPVVKRGRKATSLGNSEKDCRAAEGDQKLSNSTLT